MSEGDVAVKAWSLLLGFVVGLLALPLGLILFAESGLLSVDAVSRPPGWEVSVAHRALHASLARRAKGLRNPFAGSGSAPLIAGMKLFRDNCAGCRQRECRQPMGRAQFLSARAAVLARGA